MKCKLSLTWLLLLSCLMLAGCPDGKQSGEVDHQKVLTPQEHTVFEKINDYRRSNGLSPLIIAEPIVQQARNHSRNMAQREVGFSHEGFNQRVNNTGIRYRLAAENIAYNLGQADPAAIAVAGWIKSEGHRHNILGNFNQTGIGVVQSQDASWYFTQIFIKTAGSNQPVTNKTFRKKTRNIWYFFRR